MPTPIDKLQIDWLQIRSLGNSRLVKSSYIWFAAIPIFAKSIKKLNTLASNNSDLVTLLTRLELPFTWQLLYLAALLFGIATTIYLTRCPNIVSRFRDFTGFNESSMDGTYLVDQLYRYYYHKENLNSIIEDNLLRNFESNYYENRIPNISFAQLYQQRIAPQHLGEAFWFVHNLLSKQRKNSILACIFFYSLGFIALGIIWFENMKAVFWGA